MLPAASDRPLVSRGRELFVSTHWSVVLAAGRRESTQASEALEKLCRTYWYPLYAYVRRRGHTPEDAEDLTQSFFARLLARNYVVKADRERGRFRTFLLVALERFLVDNWEKSRREKRGGGQTFLSLDSAAEQYHFEPVENLDAARLFERRWAATLIRQALARLELEYRETGRQRIFSLLKDFLTGDHGPTTQASVGREVNLSENAVKQAVHRLRRRYRQLFRDEIAQTVAGPSDVEDELRHILAVLSA